MAPAAERLEALATSVGSLFQCLATPWLKAVFIGSEGEDKEPASTICPMDMDICYQPGYCSTRSYPAFLGGSPLYSLLYLHNPYLGYATQVWQIFSFNLISFLFISFHFPNEIFPQLSFQIFFCIN